jgi:hypothetical protein
MLVPYIFGCFLLIVSGVGNQNQETLLDTELQCKSDQDCLDYYGNEWCKSGYVCLHKYCRKQPSFPCLSTQKCIESTRLCDPIPCTSDGECNNGVYCDGEEICDAGQCIINPDKPSCINLGGVCDEVNHRCRMPAIAKQWREFSDRTKPSDFISKESDQISAQDTPNPTEAPTAEVINLNTVNLTALSIIGATTAIILIIAITILLSRGCRN